ncbi:PAS domain S-box-containing protein [Bradyrhizobium sp. Rc2d]|uniref:AAA family ATPase n=1 Tax=Bradyrhizobium sp. Rc2d TaxID=1855321 RepID=UPI000888D547|nr:AAA family ATPase [Bradyrhizobium sp. Rc2d]SDJ67510.1 PAS domain S-box-containing protein [Bradyrhizobium sp. Rc2d]
MVQQSLNIAYSDGSSQVLWEDGDRVFSRGWRLDENGNRLAVLLVAPATDHPSRSRLDRLTHEYELKDELDTAWAARPLALMRDAGRTVLVLDDLGGEPLDRLLGGPMEIGRFLRLAIAVTSALGKLHQRGLIHKDIKPANILLNEANGHVRLTGFGIASRLSRERQAPEPPETIAGTLAYMAPEQTGRMNRSIDARSDLYALGVTLYQMLTGVLPLTAADPMEWVHCHIARKPVPPGERLESVPAPVSAIIMKLLAKTPEDRYQTAGGVERDLRRCLAEWEARCRIDDFPLGLQDTPNQLLIPEKLYGRRSEVETLLSAFDRVVNSGAPEFVLVSGYSGIGKSSVVNELQPVLVPPRGLFASGKFDQYKRDIPYSTLAQAFQSLIRPLLGKNEADLAPWRDALREALGPNAGLIADLVPEVRLIIGEPPPVPELPPQDAQRRFQMVFRRFLAVFARSEHPLALFLDDLQWLDIATLDLLEDLLIHPDVQHVLLIGAYRDNEVTSVHPLMRTLDRLRAAGAPVQDIVLSPLALEHVGQLVADSLYCDCEGAAPLAELVLEKTAGNPYFVIQFLTELVEQGLVTFDYSAARWLWDLVRIHAKGYTDNLVDLMVGKLSRLPIRTRKFLQRLACLGNRAEFAHLAIVCEYSDEELRRELQEALQTELIVILEGTCRFVHDQVQEAAYSLIPKGQRAKAHLRIGRLLATHIPPEKRDEAIFDIVNQLNRGVALVNSRDDCEQIAELNLVAGKRAQASAAYTSALSYLTAGLALLLDDCWQRRHDLIFALELARAQCEFVSGAVTEAEEHLHVLSTRAATTEEKTTVACLRVDLYMSIDRSDHAVTVGLESLQSLGIDWPSRPTEKEARREYEGIWSWLGSRRIEDIIDSPLMSDATSLAMLDLLIRVAVPAFFSSSHLFAVAVCRAVSLSLERGNSDASCIAYELFAMLAGPHFGDYDAGYRFGRLGCELAERPGLNRFQARTYETFGFVIPWTKHVRSGRDLLVRSFEIANRNGDITYSGYACGQITTNYLMAGDALADTQKEAEKGLEFAKKVRFGLIVGWSTGQLGLIRTLRGLTKKFGCFDEEGFDEVRFEKYLASNPALALPECWYWIRKLQARYFAGDYAAGIYAASKAHPMLWTSLSLLEMAEYHFYGALCRAAAWDLATADQRRIYRDALFADREKLEIWARNCPENYENRVALVDAEIARIDGRRLDAEDLYEGAIESARSNGFVHNEALANELAARFYRTRGFEKIANVYLRDARRCYVRWGADGKVRQLDELHPRLRQDERTPMRTGTIDARVEQLDLATMIEVSQALSGEMVLEKLIDKLMRTALERAGAERGLLIVPQGDELRIEAEAITSGENVKVHLPRGADIAAALPESLARYGTRTHETVILDDASSRNPFSGDPYIVQRRARSILCLPLINQRKLIGILYLENNLTPNVFTPGRVAVLKVLASQAAISLENSRLYDDLADREGKIRRLVDANIIGIFIADREGRILEANDAFLRLVGYGREDLVSGRVRWTELSPPEWRERDVLTQAELNSTGIVQPFEKEYFRKDGSRVPVLVGAALFKEGGDEGLAFVLDLTERKRAEETLRASEAKFRAAIDGIAGLVAIMAPSGELESVNSPLTEYFGRTVEELKNWGTSDAVHPEDLPRVLEAYERSLAAGTPFHHELRLRRFDGEYRWFENRGAPIRDESGRITRWYCLLTDIDDRTQALARLQQMQSDFAHVNRVSMMGELAASLSHEIAQPIASARNNARAAQNFLRMQPPDLGEVREALSCVVGDADRVGEIIDRIREQIKKVPPPKQRFDLNAAINEVIVLARSVTLKNRVSVQTRLAEGLLPVLGDRIQLQQVLLNLILNAAEAMSSVDEEARELLISTEQDQAGALVAVRDSGPGIDPAYLDRVFDAFYTTKSSGTGMGLSICRSIIHAHGGKLWAGANEPRGAAFQFTLPDAGSELTTPLQASHRN